MKNLQIYINNTPATEADKQKLESDIFNKKVIAYGAVDRNGIIHIRTI